MRYYQTILSIYIDGITNESVRDIIRQEMDSLEVNISTIKKRLSKQYEHIRANNLLHCHPSMHQRRQKRWAEGKKNGLTSPSGLEDHLQRHWYATKTRGWSWSGAQQPHLVTGEMMIIMMMMILKNVHGSVKSDICSLMPTYLMIKVYKAC